MPASIARPLTVDEVAAIQRGSQSQRAALACRFMADAANVSGTDSERAAACAPIFQTSWSSIMAARRIQRLAGDAALEPVIAGRDTLASAMRRSGAAYGRRNGPRRPASPAASVMRQATEAAAALLAATPAETPAAPLAAPMGAEQAAGLPSLIAEAYAAFAAGQQPHAFAAGRPLDGAALDAFATFLFGAADIAAERAA